MKKLLCALVVLLTPLMSFSQNAEIELTMKNTIVLRGPITYQSVDAVAMELLAKNTLRGSQNYPLYLVLDSPGGYIDAGNDFLEITKTIKNLHTVTVFAASMAAAIVEQVPGTRYIVDSGVIMFHRAAGGVSGQFETGELESRLDFYKGIVLKMENRNASRMGLTLQDYKSKVINEMWLNGSNAVTQKANDQLVNLTCSKELIRSKQSVLFETFFGTFNVMFSSCPLLKSPLSIAAKDQIKNSDVNPQQIIRTITEIQRQPFVDPRKK